MQSHPWLSVLMPVYNGEAYLSSALDSIAIQEDSNIECIAIDGESTDATVAIFESYQDRIPMKILHLERKSNWINKTNYALSVAQGEYVCFLHHDDIWLDGRLKTMKHLIENFPNVIFFLHPSNFIDNKGNNLGLWSCPLPVAPEIIRPKLMIERLLVQNFISILGPIFKRGVALKVDGLNETLWYTADWDFWLKIAACGDILYHPQPLSGFRIHPTSQTVVRSANTQEFRDQLESVAKKHFSLWEAPNQLKQNVQKVVLFSTEVNISLAGTVHGEKNKLTRLLTSFLLLGPLGWYRYFRDSRILQRVFARLKARLRPAQN